MKLIKLILVSAVISLAFGHSGFANEVKPTESKATAKPDIDGRIVVAYDTESLDDYLNRKKKN